MLVLAAFACADRDAELREKFREASLALPGRRVPGSKITVEGRDGWLIHRGEVQYLKAPSFIGENAPQANRQAPPKYADPVPVIVDFHRQLQERGIELFFVPVPVRPVIYPESVLGPEPFAERETIPNLHHSLQGLLSSLRESGVQVFDLTPTFLSQRVHPERGPIFCPSDTHWTPYGITIAAKILADEIKEKPWFEAVPKQEFRQRWTTKTLKGVLYRDSENASGTVLEPDQVQMRRIMRETKKGLKNFGLHHPQSPVILIGDSNSTRWSNFRSGLPHSLAFELGFPVDVLSAAGGGANETRLNLVRKIRAEPEYLDGKRVVIWCFSARAFTNTREGWIPIPL
jgi:alginate O-acetyltransferase complex protein AlgJ